MSSRSELGQQPSVSEQAELTPRQKIVKHLKDADLLRREAFGYYITLNDPTWPWPEIKWASIHGQLRRDTNLRREYVRIHRAAYDFYNKCAVGSSDTREQQRKFVQGLREIKQELERESPQSQTPPEKE